MGRWLNYGEIKTPLGVIAQQINSKGEPYNVIGWVRTETRKRRANRKKKYVPKRLSPYWRKELFKMFKKWLSKEV